MLMIHKPKCENYDVCTSRTSSESHLHWKDLFDKIPSYFRIFADFEAGREIEDSKSVCNKTINICKQKPILKGYIIVSQLEDVLKGGLYKSPLCYDNEHWFVKEIIKLEKKWLSIFKILRKISL